MYEIEFTEKAKEDLQWFRKNEQAIILDGIESNLVYEPNIVTRNRKFLSPNSIAEWELGLEYYT